MHILMLGAGALGSYYGSQFAKKAASVSVVCRSNYNEVKDKGFTFKTQKQGSFTWMPHKTFRSVTEAAADDIFDIVIVCSKNIPEVEPIEELISPIVMKNSNEAPLVILFQNGIGIEDPIQMRFPKLLLASAVLYLAVSQSSSGIIHFNENSIQKMVMGIHSGPHFKQPGDGVDAARGERGSMLMNALYEIAKSSLDSETQIIHPEIITEPNIHYQAVRFHKIGWNASFGPVTMLTGLDTLAVLSNKDTFNLLHLIMSEVFATAKAVLARSSNKPEFEFPPPGYFNVDAYLERSIKIGPYRPSIQLDLIHGRPQEIQVIMGNVIDLAKAHDINTPCLSSVYSLLNVMHLNLLQKLATATRKNH